MTSIGLSKSKSYLLPTYHHQQQNGAKVTATDANSSILGGSNKINLSIAGTRSDDKHLPKITRKLPLKSYSLAGNMHSISSTSNSPSYDSHRKEDHYDKDNNSSSDKSPTSTVTSASGVKYQATENGYGQLLPSSTSTASFLSTNRSKTMSSLLSSSNGSSNLIGQTQKSEGSTMSNMSSTLSLRSRALTDTLSQGWLGGTRRIRGRSPVGSNSNDTLPLHYQQQQSSLPQQQKKKQQQQQQAPLSSLRSRRTRTVSHDRDENDNNYGAGYQSLDNNSQHNDRGSGGHNRVSSMVSASSSSRGLGWMSWRSGGGTNGNYSDVGGCASRLKFGRRSSKGSGSGSDYILPLTIPSPQPSTSSTFQNYYQYTTNSQWNRKRSNSNNYMMGTKSGSGNGSSWLQTLFVLTATYLVWHSYRQTQTIQNQIEIFHDKESLSLLHLKNVEQHLVHLHENFVRLNDLTSVTDPVLGGDTNNDNSNPFQRKNLMNQNAPPGGEIRKIEAVDTNLIRVQTQQLYQMEEELNHEVRTLQSKIQQVARSSIVTTFGEGPVQINLELDFKETDTTSTNDNNDSSSEKEHNTITILLWYDTPHAAWTWIQQIRAGLWHHAAFQMGKNSLSIDAQPNGLDRQSNITTKDDTVSQQLKFVEKSAKSHEPWTVGLMEMDSDDNKKQNSPGMLSMFINLQDNTEMNKRYVCVGKVIDGFDALQRLIETSRRLEGSGRFVYIKDAVPTHLSKVLLPV